MSEELEEPQHPIQAASEGGVVYFAAWPPVYAAMYQALKQAGGYPKAKAFHAIPEPDEVAVGTDGRNILAVAWSRISNPAYLNTLDGNYDLGPDYAADKVHVLSKAAFDSLKPQPTEEL